MAQRNAGGRPPKYQEPSRPITVTLPESTLRQLSAIDEDRGMAIVKLASRAMEPQREPSRVEVVKVNRKSGLLVMSHSRVLEKIPFLRLVEVGTGRFLLAVESGQDFRSLELALHDLLEGPATLGSDDLQLITDLLQQVSHLRKAGRMSLAEILLVDMTADDETPTSPKASGPSEQTASSRRAARSSAGLTSR